MVETSNMTDGTMKIPQDSFHGTPMSLFGLTYVLRHFVHHKCNIMPSNSDIL